MPTDNKPIAIKVSADDVEFLKSFNKATMKDALSFLITEFKSQAEQIDTLKQHNIQSTAIAHVSAASVEQQTKDLQWDDVVPAVFELPAELDMHDFRYAMRQMNFTPSKFATYVRRKSRMELNEIKKQIVIAASN
jgi:hypothetical protein